MELRTWRIVYPEGDVREIDHDLSMRDVVDINGNALRLPIPTARTIAYRVYRKSTDTVRREEIVTYFLELLSVDELRQYTR